MDISKVDLTNNNQKIFAGGLVVVTLTLLYFLLPPLVVLFANLWLLAILAAPVVYCVLNPAQVWNWYKQLSWGLTKWSVSKDKLGYMYRYHDYLVLKINKLDISIKAVSQARVKIQRKISDIKDRLETNKAQVLAYQEKGAPELVIKTMANKVNIDDKQLESLLPQYVAIEKQEKYLVNLYDTWVADAHDFKYLLDAKADEYTMLKEVSEATGNVAEFLKGNSEEYKIFQESLVQIENSVAEYTANIENFERKAQPLLTELAMQRTVSEDAGMKLVEEFKAKTAELTFKS